MLILNNLEVQIAGDSHGPSIFAVIEGFPFGFSPDISLIDKDLYLRQIGYGRGERMKQESDRVEIESGTWKGFTTNMPLVLRITNRGTYPEGIEKRKVPRPGHADYAAYQKYGDADMRIYAEGASARRTAGVVAAGSLCRQWLENRDIEVLGYVKSCLMLEDEINYENESLKRLRELRNANDVFCIDSSINQRIKQLIDKSKTEGDTLGGQIQVIIKGLDAGKGSFSSANKRMDSLLAANLASIPSVKGIFFGNPNSYKMYGSQVHDKFMIKDGKIERETNNSGGLEGGISNGQPIVLSVFFKPIPSLPVGIASVNVETLREEKVSYVRSDVTAIAPAAIVSEAIASITVMDFLLGQ